MKTLLLSLTLVLATLTIQAEDKAKAACTEKKAAAACCAKKETAACSKDKAAGGCCKGFSKKSMISPKDSDAKR